MKHYIWFNIKRVAHNKKWDYNTVLEEAHKYNSKTEFHHRASGAYKVALENGWMNSFDWFEESSSLQRKQLRASWENRKKWTYDICKVLAEESLGRLDFRRKSRGAYLAAYKNNWLDDLFPKKGNK